ncbi:MAG: adventurous gliding motility protein CglE [Deltaproteobacteria bacterium]|nr:adventurous gliding motility protein CglE [Deltaproteobacteria bacterium]
MIRRLLPACALVLFAVSPVMASAQEGEEEAPAKTEAPPAEEGAKPAAAPEAAEPDDRPFPIRRGFYTQADLGVFFTFGGTNTNDGGLAKKGISNIQPYLGAVFGYDLFHSTKYAFSAGVKLAAGYSGGAGRVTNADLANLPVTDINTKSADFAVLEAGVALAFAYLVSDRVAITVKGDVGLAAVDPTPALPAASPDAASAAFAPIFGVGAGVQYFTLLNDFSVGIDPRFTMVMISGYSIPGMTLSVPIRYTF